MRANALILIVFLLSTSLSLSLETPPRNGAAPKSSVTAGTEMGLAENSVNLFNGTVKFSLPFASLPFGGASFILNGNYDSRDVKRLATTWNRETPTGCIGL